MPILDEEIIASSELYDTFPRYKSSNGSIPTIVIPKSKYSSTETEFSSDDQADSGGYNGGGGGDNGKRLTVSGFSTSASSSGSGKRRRRRKRKSSSGSNTGVGGLSSSLTISIRSNMSGMSHRSSLSLGERDKDRKRNSTVPVLNSIKDLNHAIGRHRGISGSFTPAIDSTLFAMFYATDIFDGILKDELSLISHQYDSSNSFLVRKDVTSVLRKEIVYSLRTSYFCPASKIVKLAQLLEENFPLEHFYEPASFLDLILSKILSVSHPPFLTYSNGSTKYIHRLPVEERPHLKRSYYQPSVITIQQLLQRDFGGHTSSQRKYGGGETSLKFVTVPYPALILKVDRKSRVHNENHPHHHPSWTSRPNFPIIPNMEVDLTGLISQNMGKGVMGSSWSMNGQSDARGLHQSFNSALNESITSYYPASENSFSGEEVIGGGRSVGIAESRLAKGLKSAWKIMFKYLENFSSSSSDFTAQHPEGPSILTGSSNGSNYPGTTNSPISYENNARYNIYNSHGQLNHSSSSSLPSAPFQRYDYDGRHATNELEGSFSLLEKAQQQLQQPQVKLELIAIICYAGADGGSKVGRGNENTSSPYLVYCKAGNDHKRGQDNGVNGNVNTEEEFAPWILYQSRYGVAPQVTLIENFGKWISSLERNHEEFSLYEVPLEIRRVLENSDLLIYKRIV